MEGAVRFFIAVKGSEALTREPMGPWRWFSESMLDGCKPLEIVEKEGMTFNEVACVARCNGASVQAVRADELSLAAFRAFVLAACQGNVPKRDGSDDSRQVLHAKEPEKRLQGTSCGCATGSATSLSCPATSGDEQAHNGSAGPPFVIASYSRKVLGQTGSGHFSPLGAYHRNSDQVLIMDVARFKYPPHWVSLPLLWDAINTVDPDTGLRRGVLVVGAPETRTNRPCVCRCKAAFGVSQTRYSAIRAFIARGVPEVHSRAELVDVMLGLGLHRIVSLEADGESDGRGAGVRVRAPLAGSLLADLRALPLWTIVQSFVSTHEDVHDPDGVADVLLLCILSLRERLCAVSKGLEEDLPRIGDVPPSLCSELLSLQAMIVTMADPQCCTPTGISLGTRQC